MDIDAYLDSVTNCLQSRGYEIKHGVLYEGQDFKCVAKHGSFRPELFMTYFDFFFMFSHFETITFTGLEDYSEICMRYGSRNKLVPGFPIPFTYHVVFSAAIVDDVDDKTVEELRLKSRPWHFASAEFPAIYCLRSEQLYHSETVPPWMQYDSYFRALACQYLLPD